MSRPEAGLGVFASVNALDRTTWLPAQPRTAGSGGIKYVHLRDRVMEIIEGLPVGAPIPSERELCVRYSVSRMTLRRALEELARQGYLVRRQGAATYTARPKISQRLTLLSFTEDMRRRGMTTSSRGISSG